MKVLSSLRSAKTRHRDCQVISRKGRTYVICKSDPRFTAVQGKKSNYHDGSKVKKQLKLIFFKKQLSKINIEKIIKVILNKEKTRKNQVARETVCSKSTSCVDKTNLSVLSKKVNYLYQSPLIT